MSTASGGGPAGYRPTGTRPGPQAGPHAALRAHAPSPGPGTPGAAGAGRTGRPDAPRAQDSAARAARAARAAGALVFGAVLCVLGTAGPAHADGYRYWSFWEREGGSWMYAAQGPAVARPADGSVQGFRFSVSADSADAAKPRGAADFGTICGSTPAEDGSKRIALVLDFGTAGDAPGGETPPKTRRECARVPEDASTGEALAAVAKPLRYNSSALLCAIAGYPETGCGEQVSDDGSASGTGTAAPSAGSGESAADSASGDGGGDDGPSIGLYAGGAAVAALAAAAIRQARRRT